MTVRQLRALSVRMAAGAIPPLSSIAIDKEAPGAMGVELLLEKNPVPDADRTLPIQPPMA